MQNASDSVPAGQGNTAQLGEQELRMIYGKIISRRRIARRALCVCAGVLFAAFSIAPFLQAAATDSAWTAARLIAIRPDSIQVREQGGALMTASLTPSSLLLSKGVPTLSLNDFRAGESVFVRLRPPTRDGARSRVEILSDGETKTALDSCGKQVSGTVRELLPGWLVVKTDDFAAVPVELTSATLYRRQGSVVSDCPFRLGDRVAVAAHESATGTLLASSVSDEETATEPETALPFTPASTVRGSVSSVRLSCNELIVLTAQKSEVAISAPPNITSIRISRRKATLADLRPGMKVVVHLTGGSDAAGYVARTISASP